MKEPIMLRIIGYATRIAADSRASGGVGDDTSGSGGKGTNISYVSVHDASRVSVHGDLSEDQGVSGCGGDRRGYSGRSGHHGELRVAGRGTDIRYVKAH